MLRGVGGGYVCVWWHVRNLRGTQTKKGGGHRVGSDGERMAVFCHFSPRSVSVSNLLLLV